MITSISTIKAEDKLLKFIFYILPLLVIAGNAAINSAFFLVRIVYFYKRNLDKKIFIDTH